MVHKPSFILSKEDWSLHRKGYQDQQRHQEKVRDAIKKNLGDLVTEESIIMHDGRQIVKVPIRSLDEFRFRYNYNKGQHGGQGDGNSSVGDVLGRDGNGGQPQQGPGKGEGAGESPGMDYYEAEVSLEEIQDMLFKDLELPNLQRKTQDEIQTTDIRFNDIRKKGLQGNIDKKRTLIEAIKRNSLAGKPGLQIIPEDLRYKTWEEIQTPHSQAVVLAMMDTSGSMGQFEKYIARSFFFWMTRFLRTRYENVDIQYIAHHTEAKVVTEHEFFTKGESGGTICSSAYALALNMIEAKYPPDKYNIYPFHFSDGDNLSSDNEKCLKIIRQIMEVSNIFGYGEVNQYNRSSSLMNAFKNINDPKFRNVLIKEKSEVYKALCTFFKSDEATKAS